jgi:diguanylate cyclase (GGDEF)-like protein
MPLSMILFDIDFFKKVNDTYGHPGGDAVLRAVSAGVATAVRTEDVFARVGGEEFAILARSIDVAQAWGFAERLRLGIQHLVVPWENGQIPITASFGVAELSELPQPDGDALVALADRRLYEAKGGGRNRVVGPR